MASTTANDLSFELESPLDWMIDCVKSIFEPSEEEIQDTETRVAQILFYLGGPLLEARTDAQFQLLLGSIRRDMGTLKVLDDLANTKAFKRLVERVERESKVAALKPRPKGVNPQVEEFLDDVKKRFDLVKGLVAAALTKRGARRPTKEALSANRLARLSTSGALVLASFREPERPENIQRAYEAFKQALRELAGLFHVPLVKLVTDDEARYAAKIAEQYHAAIRAQAALVERLPKAKPQREGFTDPDYGF